MRASTMEALQTAIAERAAGWSEREERGEMEDEDDEEAVLAMRDAAVWPLLAACGEAPSGCASLTAGLESSGGSAALLKACVAEGYDKSHESRKELVTILEAVEVRRPRTLCVPASAP